MDGKYKIVLEKNHEQCFINHFFHRCSNAFITTEEFAKAVRNSDNYYVLITRQNLYYFSHSGDVIYGIRSLVNTRIQKRHLIRYTNKLIILTCQIGILIQI